MKVYRNIYFLRNIFKNGKGNIDIKYYGNIYSNAKKIKTFNQDFDKNKDLLIQCTDCMQRKYRSFIKVKQYEKSNY